MYEHMTFENILNRMLDSVEVDVDKSEGSIIYSALAPAAWELSEAYIAIETIYDATFADTAPREELILRAKERGMEPKKATNAILKGEFNVDIPIGSRFSLDELNYTAIEKMSNNTYKMQCEMLGTDGNRKFGELIPIEFIEDLETARLTELLIPSTDEEETENFRERYFNSFHSAAFGGNRADYIDKIKSIDGVGGVKVNRVTRDSDIVVATIISSLHEIPSQVLIDKVQTTIDPDNSKDGLGLAPVGHIVSIEGVEGFNIDIDTRLTLDTDYVLDDVRDKINDIIENYFLTLSKTWEDVGYITVRIAQLDSKLLAIDGIIDVENTKFNGLENNVLLSANEIPIRGLVNAIN